MGTSKSSSGAPSGVPLIPPWVNPVVPQDDGQSPPIPSDGERLEPPADPGLAPARRFAPARTSLGRFAATGSSEDLRRGLGHYVRTGLGGSTTAAQRFAGTARVAGAWYTALSSRRGDSASSEISKDTQQLSSRSATALIAAIIDSVRSVDGTLDGESNRAAMSDSLADLYAQSPEVDLSALPEANRLFLIERFLAYDIYNRLMLDIGMAIQQKAPSIAEELARKKDIKDYVRETVSDRFRALRSSLNVLSANTISQLASRAMRATFRVFEDYIQ